MLWGFLRVGEKDTIVSKQQLGDEFLDGFCACEETLTVKQIGVSSLTDVDAVWPVLFCLKKHDAVEDGEQGRGQDASLLDATGDGKAIRQ